MLGKARKLALASFNIRFTLFRAMMHDRAPLYSRSPATRRIPMSMPTRGIASRREPEGSDSSLESAESTG